MDELDTLIRKALEREPEGLTAKTLAKALPKAIRPSAEHLRDRLEALTAARDVFVWPGRTQRFAATDFDSFARNRMIGVLRDSGPLTEAELKRKLPRAIGTGAKALLNQLVADGSVLRHPPLARRVRFGLEAADPLPYLQVEMEAVHKRLAKLGFSPQQQQEALRRHVHPSVPAAAADAEEEILSAMQRINPQSPRGALVYLSEVRSALRNRYPDKSSFDRAVLDLAQQGKVQLQSHAWPSSLSAQEREALIDNGRGSFFDAIGVRLE